MSESIIICSSKAAKSLREGFPWVYDTEVQQHSPLEDGAVCVAQSTSGRYLATGFYNSKSKLRFRVLSTNANDIVDDAFWLRKVRWAVDYRRQVMGDDFSCCRLIFGDADFFPGLTVDRYEDVLSVEIYNLGMEQHKTSIYRAFLQVFRELGQPITAIYERSTGRLRTLEGMEDCVGFVHLPGEALTEKSSVVIRENGLLFTVDLVDGQKTGYFLDQKYNRLAASRLARDKQVLDCCTNNGGFALACAAAGAASVTALDISASALEQTKLNAVNNGLTLETVQEDVFSFLRQQVKNKNRQWDFIILDPPAFTKSRDTLEHAVQGYKEMNTLAMRLLPKGGYLVTCSCSRFLTPDRFEALLKEAAYDARVSLRLIEKRGAAPDHPVRIGATDTEYLKYYAFQIV